MELRDPKRPATIFRTIVVVEGRVLIVREGVLTVAVAVVLQVEGEGFQEGEAVPHQRGVEDLGVGGEVRCGLPRNLECGSRVVYDYC